MKLIRAYQLLILFFLFATGLHSQTIVSTSPQNRHAVLEEFGGVNCVYCPEGHAISEGIQQSNPDRVVLLNYQVGPYASPEPGDPDLQSPYGADIKAQTGLIGYPAATLNRLVFPGLEQGAPGTTALSRNNWSEAAAQTWNLPSPVNIAAQASLNIATRELNLYIEYYYTANSAAPSNRLNVAILQNNILGPQLGGSQSNHYPHQHVVRDFLTGQWGELISNPVAGYAGSRTFTINLPAAYLNVPADLANIELAIFISEGQQHILTGIQIKPTLQSPYLRDAHLLSVITDPVYCGESISPLINIRNDGQQPLYSVAITYNINGGAPAQHIWYGSLAPFSSQPISLPPIPLEVQGQISLWVSLSAPNNDLDHNPSNDELEVLLNTAPISTIPEIRLDLRTDDYGYETYWEITNELGDVLASGGNEVVGQTDGGSRIATPFDPGAYGNNQFITTTISLPEDGCYTLRVLDDFGDGMCCFYGNGFYRLRPQGGSVIIYGNEFGALDVRPFRLRTPLVSAHTPAEDAGDALPPKLWPNPLQSGESLYLSLPGSKPQPLSWQLLDAAGRERCSGQDTWLGSQPADALRLDIPALPAGYYLWRARLSDGLFFTQPLLILPAN